MQDSQTQSMFGPLAVETTTSLKSSPSISPIIPIPDPLFFDAAMPKEKRRLVFRQDQLRKSVTAWGE